MKNFAKLYLELDETTRTTRKVDALARYFQEAPPRDAAWGLFFLTGRREKRLLPSASLVTWAVELARIPPWLLLECFSAIGDFAEAIALLIEASPAAVELVVAGKQGELFGSTGPTATDLATVPADGSLASWIEERIRPLRKAKPEVQRRAVTTWWRSLDTSEVFVLTKLLTGELRVGVQQTLVMRALARASSVPEETIAARLMGPWEPSAAFFTSLVSKEGAPADLDRPYPFALASPLEDGPDSLGERSAWIVEWKWDGIRAQVVRRGDSLAIWTRGEELATERFPEIEEAARALPAGTVVDGEILGWTQGKPLPFGALQTRIGRRKLTPEILDATPVVFLAFDLLEIAGQDARQRPLDERRSALAALLRKTNSGVLLLSEDVPGATWADLGRVRESARERGVEGFLLKRRTSRYGVGRKKGDWWKWKIDPYTIDCVLVAAEPGHGKRASLFTDYTFAVRHEGSLLAIAKAYSGLTDAEIKELDAWIRSHTRDHFGHVRHVEPVRVFEIAFEAIALSPRHPSGVAVRFPRIVRERTDKRAEEADTLESVKALLKAP